MSKIDPKNIQLVKFALLILAGIFSIIGCVVALSATFGGWWTGMYSWNYYFCLGCEMTPVWAKIFLVLLAFTFIITLTTSILLILTITNKLKLLPEKVLSIIALFGAGTEFVFTIITTIIMAIIAAEANEWWLETSFYTSIIGSILIAIFFVLYFLMLRVEVPDSKTETPAK